MAQGRPKKSESQKKLHGTARKDRKDKNETLPKSGGKLGLPRGLHKTVQRQCAKIAKYLKDSGAPIDLIRPLFERYCKHLQMAYDAYNEFNKKQKKSEKSTQYHQRKKVSAKNWRDNSDAALKIEKQFEVILRKSIPKEDNVDPLEEFQRKGKKLERVK